VVTFPLLLASLAGLQGVAINQPVMGEGIVVTLAQQYGPEDKPTHVFYIHKAGIATEPRRFLVGGKIASLDAIRIYPGPFVGVQGKTATSSPWFVLVDAESAKTLFELDCVSVLQTTRRDFFVCQTESGQRWTYEVATGRVSAALGPVEGTLQVFRSGSLIARRAALKAIVDTRPLRESGEVRAILLGELRNRIEEDARIAASVVSPMRVRKSSPERDYLGELITTLGRLYEPSAVPLLVVADHTAITTALTGFGPTSVPFILDALKRPTPPGYSYQYRAELVYSIARVLQRGPEPDAPTLLEIKAAMRPILARPDSPRELINALAVVAELDDESFDPILRKLASAPAVAGARSWELADIQRAARKIFESRVVIR
jgi:hypothetical protein